MCVWGFDFQLLIVSFYCLSRFHEEDLTSVAVCLPGGLGAAVAVAHTH